MKIGIRIDKYQERNTQVTEFKEPLDLLNNNFFNNKTSTGCDQEEPF